MLNPALAATILGVSAWRKLMYSLIWQSVTWRPGKLRFLNRREEPASYPADRDRQKTRPLAGPRRSPENTAPCGAAPVARFATSVGLRPPFVAHPATVSHPDRRALLILSVAQQSCRPSAGRVGNR